ncbi:MAG TPA: S41 family peptidase [Bacteroidales bacterium]|nr:S41 family peptidase [Bacteroidales bacterium]HPZ02667.1 S41 family peptidase [Bacteroidales bacterium]HQB74434.1 S41 family peptidase [Bacteroidales bacterium]HQQ20545.1 S41 family peptidase [Bacteroidales bacterium]
MKFKGLLLGLALATSLFTVPAQNDFEIAKNVDIFVSILKELNAKYADEISPGDLVKSAIDGMLNSLDPYSVYYPESQIEDYRMMTTGQYGGIGALIQKYGDEVVISEPYFDTPSQKAGLRAGDIILKINGQSTKGKTTDEVSTILKGQPGTTLNVEVKRSTTGEILRFDIKREEIKFPAVSYFGLLDNRIGYIKLDQFTEKASSEVKDAFVKLKEEGMQYLILDLRNNGGGLLQEAVNIMNIFVDQNVTITETKGKIPEQNNVYKTRTTPLDKKIPVVVVVNEASASASEIVSGAFQDLDRGVIVGKKTFGKGLVQNVVPLSYNTSFKITVSKYYIPSGRCVQNIDYFDKENGNKPTKIPDSLAVAYKTKNGRTVYDKGGVEPDVITDEVVPHEILITLILNNLIFDFANQYHANNPEIAEAAQFQVTPEIYTQFQQFLKGKEYSYKSETEALLEQLTKVATEEQYLEKIDPIIKQLNQAIEEEKERDLIKYQEEISQYLAMEIVTRYYYQKGKIVNLLVHDPDIKVAKQILIDQKQYQSILSGK